MAPRRSTRSRNSGSQVPELEDDVPNIEEDEIDEEEDEIEEVTRCICGNTELQLAPNNPDIDDIDPGFFIQCEECQVWQHGYCVGIKDEVDAPDKYWCELCKPELHTLVYKGPKDKRSIYTPVLEKKKKLGKKIKEEKEEIKRGSVKSANTSPSSSASTAVTAEAAAPTAKSPTTSSAQTAITIPSASAAGVVNSSTTAFNQSASPETRHRRERSRGTLNSRDAEYEMMLKKALEESAKESGVQPEDPELSEYTRERSSRRRTRHEDDIKREDKEDVEHDSGNMEEVPGELHHPDSKRRKVDSQHESDHTDNTDAFTSLTVDTTITQGDEDKRTTMRLSQAAPASTLNDLSDNDSSSVSKTAVASSSKKKRPRRAVNLKPKAETQNGMSSPKRVRSKEEIDADKPTKPRLPQQRISLYEMRKRTSAILEFLVRTQSELRHEFEHGVDITEFIDDNTSKSDLNKEEIKMSLEKGYKDSVNLMENLTRKIIDWNTKYVSSVFCNDPMDAKT